MNARELLAQIQARPCDVVIHGPAPKYEELSRYEFDTRAEADAFIAEGSWKLTPGASGASTRTRGF